MTLTTQTASAPLASPLQRATPLGKALLAVANMTKRPSQNMRSAVMLLFSMNMSTSTISEPMKNETRKYNPPISFWEKLMYNTGVTVDYKLLEDCKRVNKRSLSC